MEAYATHESVIYGTRMTFLRAARAVRMGAAVRGNELSPRPRAAAVAAAVLCALARTLHGPFEPVTEPSAAVGAIARFLYGGLHGRLRNSFDALPADRDRTRYHGGVQSMALSRDGATLILTLQRTDDVSIFRVADGTLLRVLGRGSGPMEFAQPNQVYVADDGYIFIADTGNFRIQVLAPDLNFHQSFGRWEEMLRPSGVCANDTHVFVSALTLQSKVCVYRRADGTLQRLVSVGGVGAVGAAANWRAAAMDIGSPLWLAKDARGVDTIVFHAEIRWKKHKYQQFIGVMCPTSGIILESYGREGGTTPGLEPRNLAVVSHDTLVANHRGGPLCFYNMNTHERRLVRLHTHPYIGHIGAIAVQGRVVVATSSHLPNICLVLE